MQAAGSRFEADQMSALMDRVSRLMAEGTVLVAEVSDKLRIHPSTVTRWMLNGVLAPDGRRVRLEHYRVGGSKLATSWPALERFLASIQAPAAGQGDPPRTANQRRRDAEKAEAELERLGVG